MKALFWSAVINGVRCGTAGGGHHPLGIEEVSDGRFYGKPTTGLPGLDYGRRDGGSRSGDAYPWVGFVG
jgi:hypothetical protein